MELDALAMALRVGLFAGVFAAGAAGCSREAGPPVVGDPAGPVPSAADASADVPLEPGAIPHVEPGESTPYGYWGLNGYVTPAGLVDVRQRLQATVFHTATIDAQWAATELLPMVRAAGMTVTLRMTGDHEHYTTPEGDFDLRAWLGMLAPWDLPALRPFIEDGTLAGHMLLDDIYNFEGEDPTAVELEAMARRSKDLLPGLMTFVRERATVLPVPPAGRFRHVDACVNQYKAAHGDVARFARQEAAQARALGLGFINGLNIANGGDGSSGQAGWGKGKHAMSAAEIARYGTVLAQVPGNGMFLNWEYDGRERWSDGTVGSDWFDRPELQQALVDLGRLVASQPPGPLLEATESPESR